MNHSHQQSKTVQSGIPAFDEVVQNLRLGDNVVWQVDQLQDYVYFAGPFARQAIRDGRPCVYLRFAPHPPVLQPQPGLDLIELNPAEGFDPFSAAVHKIIRDRGRGVCYVFDNLSSLVEEWATDELLANFFQVTCPFLFELDTVTYFALTRGQHNPAAVARIRDTTQILIDAYHVNEKFYIHPIKVWDRYSPQMFLPHVVSDDRFTPVLQSGDASAVAASARRQPLRTDARSIAPWDSVYRRLMQYHESGADLAEPTPELTALRQEFSRMLLGNHPEFNRIADTYFTIGDLFHIRSRLIGSGRIGGKAAGMLLARRILLSEPGRVDFSQILEEHDSFFIGSDVFFTFLVNNDLFRLRLQLSRNSQITHEEFEEVERRFLAGDFPRDILDQFREMLDHFGQAPIIVRSSSLLEDSFGNAFAGKYRSEYCANQGSPDRRLEAFLHAVKLVYASALNPDALSYRRRRGLGDSDEQMAILVQRVSGTRHGRYFFPPLAGVAFSRNLYVWTNRIDPKKGIIRLVFGLGTRAVNRVGGDYPRMIAVSNPQLRPEVGMRIAKYSQREVDVLDLEADTFATRTFAEVVGDGDYPNLALFVSQMKDGYLQDPFTPRVSGPISQYVLTFNNLIAKTNFVAVMGEMLEKLERAYGYPIDTEFTAFANADGTVRVNLLQCRPMWVPGAAGAVSVPDDIPREAVLFRADHIINGGAVRNIQYVIYIDPKTYAGIPQVDVKKTLGRLVGRLNEHARLARGRFLLMGPGRWGSSNIDLGVNVSYADIDNTAVLVEMAREEAGHVPEVSYGTHFFQDLVEGQIIYLPVYPDDPRSQFNRAFFESAPNLLAELLPDAAPFADYIHVIDVPAVSGGKFVHVLADPETQRAVCFLEGA
ncbi:MAG: phosphoenolpyruvate synthase [Candidatus Sumerlaeia bacterium]|nr:phosphoenolpyruvate synthase [Candidatus Sumerlaeia bacterium]